MAKYFLVVILLVSSLIVGSGCSSQTSAPETSSVSSLSSSTAISLEFEDLSSSSTTTTSLFPLEIIDQLGRSVTINKVPSRIVSIAPSNTEILYALGLQDCVAGVTDYDNYPPEVKEKPSVGGYSMPNIEELIDLSPDLVVASSIHEKQIIPQLEAKGLTVVALAPKNIKEVMESITLIGQITAKEAEAFAVVTAMQDKLQIIQDKTSSLSETQKPKVFYIVWHDPLQSAGSGTFLDELITLAGGTNIAGDLEGYPKMTLETVIQSNPQVIIAGVGMGSGADAPLVYAQTEPRLSEIEARQNNKIFMMDSSLVGRVGPRIVDALEEFARLIHPELFE